MSYSSEAYMRTEVCTEEISEWDLAFYSFCLITYLFRPHLEAYGILVPQPGTEPMSSAFQAQSLNHWDTREVPTTVILYQVNDISDKLIEH